MSEHNQHVGAEYTEHIVSPWIYFGVYLALLAGVGLTILASQSNLGIWNPILTLSIAFAQATLVALYSMHLKYSSKLTKLCVFSCLFTLGILFTMSLMDLFSRAWGSF